MELERQTTFLSCLHGLLKGLDEPFNWVIGGRMVWCRWVCWMPFAFRKSANSCVANRGTLSDTNWTGQKIQICLRTTLVSSTVVDFIRKINPIPGQAHTNVLRLGNGMLVSLYHRFQGEGTISLWHWSSWNGLTTNTQPSSGFRLQALDFLCYCVLNGKQDWTCRHNLGLAIVLQL